MRQRAPQKAGGTRQRRHGLGSVFLAGEMREMHGRVRQIGGNVDLRHRDTAHARVFDLVDKEIAQLALNLIRHALCALRVPLHYVRRPYRVRDTSTISYTSRWSPFSISLKPRIDNPHSKPAFTSRTSSLKRFSESSSPSWITTLSRSKRIFAPRRTTPSST